MPGRSTPKQFDVFTNPLKNRAAYPLIVVLQSPFADLSDTRIVATATRYSTGSGKGGVLRPKFTVDGQDYTLEVFQLTSMKVTDLSNWVANIASVRDLITVALDNLLHDNS